MTEPAVELCIECGVNPREVKRRSRICVSCRGKRPGNRNRAERLKGSGWDGKLELELLRDLCRRDFWSFFLYAFGAGLNVRNRRWLDLSPDGPQARLAKWFQHHVDDWLEDRRKRDLAFANDETPPPPIQKHLAILVHRKVGKTTEITEAGQAWLHIRDPEFSSYIGAESTKLARKMLTAVKGVMDGSDPHAMFGRLYGNWMGTARTWSLDAVTHAARKNTSRTDPSIGTFAVETSIVGAHPDAIFYDDPISYESLASDTGWLEAVNSQVSSLTPVLQSDGLMVWVGTRYDDMDHFGAAFESEGVASLEGMPTDAIKLRPDGAWHVFFMSGRDPANRANHDEGEPTTPLIWTDIELRKYQKKDPLRYAAQVMNDPAISELNPLTREQIRQCFVPKERVPYRALRYILTTDTAFWDGLQQAGKDETVIQVWGLTRDGSGEIYYIEGYGSKTWRAEDFGTRIVVLTQRLRARGHRVIGITDEVTMAGKKGSWELNLRNMFADANEPMPTFYPIGRHSEKKEHRLKAAASFWAKGFVHLVEGAPGVERLAEQMARIGQYAVNPRIKIDWADAASDAFYEKVYVPARRGGINRAPYEPGATPLDMEGLDRSAFEDDDLRAWFNSLPREPLS